MNKRALSPKLLIIAFSIFLIATCSASSDQVAGQNDDKLDSPSLALSGAANEKMAEGFGDSANYYDSTVDSSMDRLEQERGILVPTEGDSGSVAIVEGAKKLSMGVEGFLKQPELLARVKTSDLEALPLESRTITILVAGQRARVLVDLAYSNPGDRQLEGTLMVSLPNGASPAYLGIFSGAPSKKEARQTYGGAISLDEILSLDFNSSKEQDGLWGELRPARVVDPISGRESYEDTTRAKVDPALGEYSGTGAFSARVFPIEAQATKRILFAYDIPVASQSGVLVLPLPLYKEAASTGVNRVVIVGDGLLKARLLSGDKEIQKDAKPIGKGPSWSLDGSKELGNLPVLTASLANPSLQVLSGRSKAVSGALVHARVFPKVASSQSGRKTGKALFIIDTSYSTRDKLYSASGELLKRILDSDASISSFACVAFDVRAWPLTEGFVANSGASRKALYDQLASVWLEGATNIQAVLELLRTDKNYADADTVFLLSDGELNWGITVPSELSSWYEKELDRPWFCYATGTTPVNEELFSTLARSGGMLIRAVPGQDLDKTARAHLSMGATFGGAFTKGQDSLAIDGSPSSVYPGQALDIAIRVREPKSSARLGLKIGNETQYFDIPLAESAGASEIAARAWAEGMAKALLNLYDKDADLQALALSQAFGIANRAASFLMLESDDEYEAKNIKTEALDIQALTAAAEMARAQRPFGVPDISGLPDEAIEAIKAFSSIGDRARGDWSASAAILPIASAKALLAIPEERGKGDAKDLYLWAKGIMNKAKDPLSSARALRVLSTIVENAPTDDRAFRMAGFVLLEWGLYAEAEALFAQARIRRPFEPQNYLLEGIAEEARGDYVQAAARYELALATESDRFSEYTTPVVTRLYGGLLRATIATIASLGDAGAKYAGAKQTLAIRAESIQSPKSAKLNGGRLLLFWNLDNTDVDLHVFERGAKSDFEVFYEAPDSPNGGKLFWDNTTGLGPELYEYPSKASKPFDVFVHYFGSRDVAGEIPAATLVLAFTGNANGSIETRFYGTVLVNVQGELVPVMPKWEIK